jgi:hypothetical protein
LGAHDDHRQDHHDEVWMPETLSWVLTSWFVAHGRVVDWVAALWFMITCCDYEDLVFATGT